MSDPAGNDTTSPVDAPPPATTGTPAAPLSIDALVERVLNLTVTTTTTAIGGSSSTPSTPSGKGKSAAVTSPTASTTTTSFRPQNRRDLISTLESASSAILASVCTLPLGTAGNDALDPLLIFQLPQHTIPYLYFLNARLGLLNQRQQSPQQQAQSRELVVTALLQIPYFITNFDKQQAQWIGSKVTEFARLLAKLPTLLQQPSSSTLGWLFTLTKRYAPTPENLTPLHAITLQQALSAKCYRHAIHQFSLRKHPIKKFDKSMITDLTIQDFMLYQYYVGLVFIGMQDWESALDALTLVLSGPTATSANVVSAIQLEAYKRYVLVSLLLHGKILPLPKYTSPSVVKAVRSGSSRSSAVSSAAAAASGIDPMSYDSISPTDAAQMSFGVEGGDVMDIAMGPSSTIGHGVSSSTGSTQRFDICPYNEFAGAFESFSVSRLNAVYNKFTGTFERDNTHPLIQQCLSALKNRLVTRLTNTYLTLSLLEIGTTLNTSSVETNAGNANTATTPTTTTTPPARHAENHLFIMTRNGHVAAKMDLSTQMVSFTDEDTMEPLEEHEETNEATKKSEMKSLIERIMSLSSQLTKMDERISSHRDFLAKQIHGSAPSGSGKSHGHGHGRGSSAGASAAMVAALASGRGLARGSTSSFESFDDGHVAGGGGGGSALMLADDSDEGDEDM